MPRKSRPLIRVGAALVVAMAGAVLATFGDIHDPQRRLGIVLPTYAGAAIVLAAGMIAVKASARGIRESSTARMGDVRASSLSKVVGLFGAAIVALWTLNTLGVGIQALLLGGALTGVVLGIAAQQTLGNLIAGVMLIIAKPVEIGQETVIKSTLGEYVGRIENIGFLYVTMSTSNGRVDIPNAVTLASAVGPGARTTPPEEKPDEAQAPETSGPS